MSKKHDRNVRYLARAQAYVRIATEALHQAGVSLGQLDIGPSVAPATSAQEKTVHAMRDLESHVFGAIERLVCS